MAGRMGGFLMSNRVALAVAVALGASFAGSPEAVAQFAGSPSLANVNAAGDPANADSWAVSVSGDGTLIAFASDADNLVPLDNNGDTDVFLHDTVTGITSRISVNFQGEEATGDSNCPSMSADGRFVAFSSRAWNMVQGGSNVGTLPWDVYLHDRQGPSTIRLSVPLSEDLSTENSGCPAISADGHRVAFASEAPDLVQGDTNGVSDVFVYDVASGTLLRASVADDEAEGDARSIGPALSADGDIVAFSSYATNLSARGAQGDYFAREQVYVRDLAAGTTELVSRSYAHPFTDTNGPSCCAQVSADGENILFGSQASNLLSNLHGRRPMRLYVYDRASGGIEGIEPLSLGEGPCSWPADPLVCDPSESGGAALSADGRFVAFLSGSFGLLPENWPVHSKQIYLQDRLTRRLRRVTVDPTGYPIHSYPCGGSSSTLALSADGQILAFVGENAEAFGLARSSGADRDIVRLELPCDPDGGSCREVSSCPGSPATTCESADRSRLRIRRNPPLTARSERFYWRWVGPGDGSAQPFVDPDEGRYQLCVYAGETMHAQIDAGVPAGAPWQGIKNGWQRKDPDGAVGQVRLRTHARRKVAKVVTSSPALDLPYLPLAAPAGVTVQLHETTTGRCWEAAFPETAIGTNTRGAILPGRVARGAFNADLK